MATATVEELEIIVRAKIDEAMKSFDRLFAKMNQKPSTSLGVMAAEISNTAKKAVAAVSHSIERNKGQIEKVSKELGFLTRQIDIYAEKGIKIGEMKGFDSAEFEMFALRMDKMQFKADGLKDKLQALQNPMQQVGETAERSAAKIERAFESRDNFSSETERLRNFTSQLDDLFSRIGNKFSSVFSKSGKDMAKIPSSIGKMTSNLKGFSVQAEKSKKAISNFAVRIKDLVSAAFVFNVIRRGLSALHDYFGGLLKTNDKFVKSLNSIKINLQTAFYPIYATALPAINSIMDAINQATGYLAAFISILFGTTYEQSRAAAKALNNQAKSIKKLEKAARGALAPFDDLNVLTRDMSDSDLGDLGDIFDEIEPPKLDESILNKFKETTDAIFDWLGIIRKINDEGIITWELDPDGRLAKALEILNPLLQGFKDAWKEIGEMLSRFWDKWIRPFLERLGLLGDDIDTNAWYNIGKAAGYLIGALLGFKALNFLADITGIKNLIKWLGELVFGSKNVTDAFKGKNKALQDQIKETAKDKVKVEELSRAYEKASVPVNAFADALGKIPQKLPELKFPPIPVPDIPEIPIPKMPNLEFPPVKMPNMTPVQEWLNSNPVHLPELQFPPITIPDFEPVREKMRAFNEWAKENPLAVDVSPIPVPKFDSIYEAVRVYNEWKMNNPITVDVAVPDFEPVRKELDKLKTPFEKLIEESAKAREAIVNKFKPTLENAAKELGNTFPSEANKIKNSIDMIPSAISEAEKIIAKFPLSSSSAFGKFGENVTTTFDKARADFKNLGKSFSTASDEIGNFKTNSNTNISDFWEHTKTALQKTRTNVETSSNWNNATANINKFLSGSGKGTYEWAVNVSTNIHNVGKNIDESIYSALKNSSGNFVAWANGTSEGMAKWGKNISENAGKTSEGFGKNIMNMLSSAWEGIKNFFSAIGEKISGVFKPEIIIPAITTIGIIGAGVAAIALTKGAAAPLVLPTMMKAIPGFADGAVLRTPTVGLMAEYAGATSNPEIVTPQNIMYDTVIEANGVLAVAISDFANRIVEAIKENKPIAWIGDKDIFDANQRGASQYNRMVGVPNR